MGGVMDDLELVDLAHGEFERRLRSVTGDQWTWSTPCSEWTVRDLVNHVVSSARLYVLMLNGCSREQARAELDAEVLGDDPVGAFESYSTALVAAFQRPDALEHQCEHPFGDLSGRRLLRGRAADVTFHTWDLAKAIGADERLDDRLVELALEVFLPSADRFLAAGAVAAPTGPTDESVPPQVRLLRLAGRNP
jgi:uncharacterized protein (TIGR03086 family)